MTDYGAGTVNIRGADGVWVGLRTIQGPVGATGPRGPMGEDGKCGQEGPTGPVGPTGPSGSGPRGATGPAGAVGPTGPAGGGGAGSLCADATVCHTRLGHDSFVYGRGTAVGYGARVSDDAVAIGRLVEATGRGVAIGTSGNRVHSSCSTVLIEAGCHCVQFCDGGIHILSGNGSMDVQAGAVRLVSCRQLACFSLEELQCAVKGGGGGGGGGGGVAICAETEVLRTRLGRDASGCSGSIVIGSSVWARPGATVIGNCYATCGNESIVIKGGSSSIVIEDYCSDRRVIINLGGCTRSWTFSEFFTALGKP